MSSFDKDEADYADPGDTHPGDSWQPVDLAAVLDGGCASPVPVILGRDGGGYLLYAGKIHTITGENESLKTWLILLACAEVMNNDGHVLYVDYEDTAEGICGRLLALGCSRDLILKLFSYSRPDEPYGPVVAPRLAGWLDYRTPELAVIDGVTEAMESHGLNPLDNSDVARFNARLPKPLAAKGSAIVMIDHPAKSREGRGRWALGAQHKLSAVDGSAYTIDLIKPFGHGLHGMAKIIIAKDRPGRVREHSPDGIAGILHLRSEPDGSVLGEIRPHREFRGEESGEFRPTVLMERISRACEGQPGLTKSALITAAKGKTDHKKLALELLVREKYITEKKVGNSFRHVSAEPFRQNLTPDPEPDPT